MSESLENSVQPWLSSVKPRANRPNCCRWNRWPTTIWSRLSRNAIRLRTRWWNPVIEGAAKANELKPDLLRAVVPKESQFYPCPVSEKGARGLMQLIPSAAQQVAVRAIFDPKQNIEAGTK